MPEHGGAHVALFIDWDNLAISTAADHGGAVPDLRRIVGVAQTYGTVLVARAYAEWGVTSDRLNVYRAGVEPVYAPTFRFEADVPGQPSRGKSLADPCLVADCIDLLHLHPSVATLVLVSGDKDLIPIVRLAQLRGKRVVVIGPDLVAAVLKDMADEYVPYRTLVGPADARSAAIRAEVAELGRRRRRRGGRGRGTAADQLEPTETESAVDEQEAEAPPAHGPRLERRERRPFVDRAGVFRGPEPAPASPEPSAELEAPEARTAEPETPIAPAPAALPPAREPAVERRREPAERRPQPAPERIAEAPASPAAAQPASEVTTQELFQTIQEILRERTNSGRPRLRATNLKDYLLARMPGFSERNYGFPRFDALLDAARSAGIIAVEDAGPVRWISLAEPNAAPAAAVVAAPARTEETPAPRPPIVEPVEALEALVAMRHRTRVLTQTYVVSNLNALVNTRAPGAGTEEEARRLLDRLVAEGAVRCDREPQEVEVNGARHRLRLCHLVDEHPAVQRAEASWREANVAEPAANGPTAQPEAEGAQTPELAERPQNGRNARRRSRGRGRATAEPTAEPATGEASAEPATTESAGPAPESDGGRLDAVFDALVEAVRQSIPPGRDTAGAAGVKSRLGQTVENFNERDLGFSKFKDFLLAAEKAGRVRVESSGAATRVGLPQ